MGGASIAMVNPPLSCAVDADACATIHAPLCSSIMLSSKQ
jgi:hypothetical protein